MELQEFISATLIQVLEGVRDANAHQLTLNDGGQINPHPVGSNHPDRQISRETKTAVQDVEFDVAVTVEKGTETKGGILVVLGAVSLGSSGKSDKSTATVSRIKFSIPIGLPRPGSVPMRHPTK